MHEGNVKVALNNKAKISKVEAKKIAEDGIRSYGDMYKGLTKFKYSKCELSVWDDKLIWK